MRVSKIAAATLLAACIGLGTSLGFAAYINPGLVGAADANCDFTRSYAWDFPAAGADNQAAHGVNWTVAFTSAALGAGRDQVVTIVHADPAPKCHAIDGAPPTFNLTFKDPPAPGNPGALVRPLVGTGNLIKIAAEQQNHPAGAQTHADLVAATITLPAAGNATIFAHGRHFEGALRFSASVTGPATNVVIIPDFRKADGSLTEEEGNRRTINVGTVAAGSTRDVPLPASKVGTGEPLTSYRVVASGSPTTDTHLAFIGLVDGILSELDLDKATALFAPGGEFFVPLIQHETLDLFVFVDLTQWLSVMSSFAIGDIFDFSSGLSAGLPGFLASTTPIGFTAGVGPNSAAPFTGRVQVAAIIDGSVVPAPGTVALFVPVLLLLAWTARRTIEARRASDGRATSFGHAVIGPTWREI